jgi:tetratricopeptide (TPR) repeat protein
MEKMYQRLPPDLPTPPSSLSPSPSLSPPLSPSPSLSSTSELLSRPAQSKSDELKDQGNEAMKLLDYALAVSKYTSSLEADPANLLTRNNRAQAYLKLKQFGKAEADASYVLEKDTSCSYSGGSSGFLSKGTPVVIASPTAKKALFRRAMAYGGQGGNNRTLDIRRLNATALDVSEKIWNYLKRDTLTLSMALTLTLTLTLNKVRGYTTL